MTTRHPSATAMRAKDGFARRRTLTVDANTDAGLVWLRDQRIASASAVLRSGVARELADHGMVARNGEVAPAEDDRAALKRDMAASPEGFRRTLAEFM